MVGMDWQKLDAIFQDLPALLTARDLEALLQIDVKTVYGYVQRGLIPFVRIQSNVRFLKYQILGWIKEQNFQPETIDRRRAS